MNNKICISIGDVSFFTCLKLVSTYPLVEIRLDLLNLDPEKIDMLAMQSREWIATCREGTQTERERTVLLAAAIRSGATYVDIEYDSQPEFRNALIELAHKQYCKVIISYHNFEETPDNHTMHNIIRQSKEMGAHYVKLAVKANISDDCLRILSLYQMYDNIIAFAMGDVGKITRVAAPFLGAAFTFASIDEAHKTAPGQLTASEMETIFRIIQEQCKNQVESAHM